MHKRFTFLLLGTLIGLPTLYAQAQRVTGTVTDIDDEPLPGVNIVEQGTTNGTLTDADGNYALTVNSDTATLIFTYVGFTREEVSINNRSTIDMTLVEDIASLSEVVVIGYGTQRKENVSGAISTVGSEAIDGRPVADVESALQGQIPGLQITSNSGRPGAGNSVRIRGTSSITGGSEPLYVIDGNIISTGIGGGGNPLATINPADIASVNVLKDASAAAIYGARAANGVIIVTTKRGEAGEPKINVNVFGGVQSATNTLDLLNAQQYQQVRNTVADNAGVPRIPNLDGTTLTTNTDWQDAVLQSAAIQSYEISASGGGTNTTYYTSLRHYDEEGIIIGTGMHRTSLRINTDTQLGRFKVGNSLTVSRTKFDREFFANGRGTLQWSIFNSPAIEIRDPDNIGGYNGPTNDDGDTGVLNPVAAQDLIDRESFVNRILGNVFSEYEIVEGLNYRINFGVDLSSYQNKLFAPFFDLGTGDAVVGLPNGAEIREERGDNVSLLLENTLNFRRSFGAHNLDLLVGYTVQDDQRQEIGIQTVGQNIGQGFPVISASTESPVPPSGFLVEERTVSYIGRVLYDYADRYLATFNFRRDGSSIFTRENFFDNFFSGSVGWVISNEAFMEDNIFSNLKLRASYGFLGNDQINANATNAVLNTNARYVFGNEQLVLNTFAPGGRVANPNLVWEKQEQLNIGLDIGVLDNKLTATIDYFTKNSNDLLLSFPLPRATGFDNIFLNAAEVENRGVELAVSYNNQVGDFSYGVSGNITFLDNEVISLTEGLEAIERNSNNQFTARNRIEPGNSLFAFYGYQVEGIYQSEEEITNGPTPLNGTAPGDLRFADVSGPDGVPDGVITEDDRTFIGDANQDVQYGLTLTAGYKGWDFSAQFQGVAGNDIWSDTKFLTQSYFRTTNLSTVVLGAWTPDNPSTTTPRAIPNVNSNNDLASSFFVEDGSYLRLKNLQIGYSLPSSLLDNVQGLSRVRVYFAGQNVFTITDYLGYDPEVGQEGFDDVVYPQSRRFTVGIQVGF